MMQHEPRPHVFPFTSSLDMLSEKYRSNPTVVRGVCITSEKNYQRIMNFQNSGVWDGAIPLVKILDVDGFDAATRRELIGSVAYVDMDQFGEYMGQRP